MSDIVKRTTLYGVLMGGMFTAAFVLLGEPLTTGCAAITPFNFQKWFKIMTPGINSTAFLRSVMVSDFTASAGGRRNFNYPKARGNGILRMYLGKIFSGQIFAPGGTMPLGGLSES